MAKVPCRLAALDLDGTLLNDEHVVTDRNCEALQKLSVQGVVVVPRFRKDASSHLAG